MQINNCIEEFGVMSSEIIIGFSSLTESAETAEKGICFTFFTGHCRDCINVRHAIPPDFGSLRNQAEGKY